jgi:hypothetical protein
MFLAKQGNYESTFLLPRRTMEGLYRATSRLAQTLRHERSCIARRGSPFTREAGFKSRTGRKGLRLSCPFACPEDSRNYFSNFFIHAASWCGRRPS